MLLLLRPPAPADTRLKTPLKSRTLSPSQRFLSPNNDDFEKAQARAARAAAHRRKSFVHDAGLSRVSFFGNEDVLSKDQILDLFQNCIKLATENKINQRNTWELRLIDHISEIVKADEGDDAETNFQKASCTLEAGIKIYSYRVDSVHSETFKVLGGLNRTVADERDGSDTENHRIADGTEEDNGNQKKDIHKRLSTASSTLESYDALNVKKFDVAFSIDPLFNQTSSQFDEGGAKGLLLNTLSVFNGCMLVFDSNEIPTKGMKSGAHFEYPTDSSMIDLSYMKDCFQKLKADMQTETEISPTLQDIVIMLDDPYRAEAVSDETNQTADYISGFNALDPCEEDMGEVFNEGGSAHFDENNEQGNDESVAGMSPDCVTWDSYPARQDKEDNFGNYDAINMEDDAMGGTLLVNWITVLDLPSKSNAWTGPDHWKYKRPQEGCKGSELSGKIPERRNTKSEKFPVDFLHPPKIDMSAFAPVPDPRALIMPQSTTVSTLLPEDCHYQADDLVRLYLQPSVMCINQLGRKKKEATRLRSSEFETGDVLWENTCTYVSEDWDDENAHSDVEDPENGQMIPKPRKVQKIEVNYDKTSKQIDVRVLKETLWENIQEMLCSNKGLAERTISFRSLLNEYPTKAGADTPGDISVHLCFICLLHLANEHSLRIDDCRSLNELHIYKVNAD